jgi:hypothetical protein
LNVIMRPRDFASRKIDPENRHSRGWRWPQIMIGVAIAIGVCVRLGVLLWTDPWTPHHPDEHILPLEALALWEGVTPREVGWPASTTRLTLSGAAAAKWVLEESRSWARTGMDETSLAFISQWIGAQYVDPTGLYQIGRALSIATGVLQLVAVMWALGQWMGSRGVAFGTLAAAIAPLSVLHSQYVLADVTGLLFATLVVGLAARLTPARVAAMGACAGLAAASKFHFGIWLLVPVLSVAMQSGWSWRRRCGLALFAIATCIWTMITFVPWFWTNPLLVAKELAGVVVVKVGDGSSPRQMVTHVATLLGGLGVLTWGGAAIGLLIARHALARIAPVLTPAVITTIGLAMSAIVFDRYGLVVLPGLLVLAGLGWEHWLAVGRSVSKVGAVIVVASCTLLTGLDLLARERQAAEPDVDAIAKAWVVSHVERGSRVAVHQEANAFLPRARSQLTECAGWGLDPTLYARKWRLFGVASKPGGPEPMWAMTVNDELFQAYWCRRELQAQTDPGYDVVTYHTDSRFGAVLESDVIRRFRADSPDEGAGRIDVLILNRAVGLDVPPAAVLKTRRGQRVIYVQRSWAR